jgi:hypothetical protein
MSKYQLPECARSCVKSGEECDKKSCRMWVDYEGDQNCSLVSIYHNGSMTLDEVSKRLKISLVRVSQIEKQALAKLSKRIKI